MNRGTRSQIAGIALPVGQALEGADTAVATAATESPGGDDGPTFGGYLDDVSNYDGSVTDATGQDRVPVTVGAEGNNSNVVARDGADFESELTAESGFTFEHTFEDPGTVTYFCRPHESLGMKGGVVVGESEGGETADADSDHQGSGFAETLTVGGGLGLAGALFGLFVHGVRSGARTLRSDSER